MKKTLLALAAGAAAIASATAANASTFVINNVSTQYGSPTGQVSISSGYYYNSTKYYDGSFSPQNISGTWDGKAVSFLAYCLEVTQTSSTGSFNVVSLSNYLGGALYNDVASLVSNYAGGNKDQSAALQLALWETRYENSAQDNLKTGTFKLSSVNNASSNYKTTLINTANSYLANKGAINGNLEFWVATNDKKQDLLFYTVKPPVPEPATWAMMIIGFAAIGRTLRARRPNMAISFS